MEGVPAQPLHTCRASCSCMAVQMFPLLPETWQGRPAPWQCPWVCWMQILINHWDWQRFQCSGSLAKSRLITASLPFSTASIFDVLYIHLLLTRPKITSFASILYYKQWPWVYNLKNSQIRKSLSFTSPFSRSNVQPIKPHSYFISIVSAEIPLPQKIPKLVFS